jgi:hypothetical protein
MLFLNIVCRRARPGISITFLHAGYRMTEAIDHDLPALKEWLRKAWYSLSDASLVPFERQELRNSMKEVELALSDGLKRIEQRERSRREAEKAVTVRPRIDFRIIQLDA